MKKPKKQGPTAQEKALEQVSIAQWNDYVARFRPAEAELARRAEFTEGEKLAARGMASADSAAAFKGLTRQTVLAQSVSGADESSGRTKLAMAGNAEAQGRARGLAGAAAVTGQKIQSDAERLGITAIGRNIASQATSDMAAGARRATSLALAASEAKFARNEALVDAVGLVAGAGVRRYQLNKQKKHEEFADTLPVDTQHVPRTAGEMRKRIEMQENYDHLGLF